MCTNLDIDSMVQVNRCMWSRPKLEEAQQKKEKGKLNVAQFIKPNSQ
jgi:hypothetical protein